MPDLTTAAGHMANIDRVRAAMGIDWMTRDQLAQAIPPAYTQYIGEYLMHALTAEAS